MERVIHGDALELLRTLPDESVDSVVTDPPYALGFMHAKWDTFSTNKEYAAWVEDWARECLRVLKPGGHLLAFSSTRTYHALAWGVESAGFEIRDMIEWLYLSGLPKSMDIGKQFDKRAGVERKVIGYDASRARPNRKYQSGAIGNIGGNGGISDRSDNGATITVPATPLAKQWDG